VVIIAKFNSKDEISIFSNTKNAPRNYPPLSDFKTNKSDTFLIKEEDYSRIGRATPYFGDGSGCDHGGGHIHFSNAGTPYLADIISPVDGEVTMINNCHNLGTHDKFDIGISFAQLDGDEVILSYSIEPVNGIQCGNNPDIYDQYILVENGQKVQKGDVIARMPKADTGDDNAHIHFQLNLVSGGIYCPNIFDEKVTQDFSQMYHGQTCAGREIPATFCFEPAPGQDLFEDL
ncbi:MAG TPA: hypothetical protein VGA67_05395, partial [Candidatus Dojkabacteria bacterium]